MILIKNEYSFGFSSAVQAATQAIASANVEAECADHGVGLVNFIGKSIKYIGFSK